MYNQKIINRIVYKNSALLLQVNYTMNVNESQVEFYSVIDIFSGREKLSGEVSPIPTFLFGVARLQGKGYLIHVYQEIQFREYEFKNNKWNILPTD